MNLEKLVPPPELCQKIPAGEFEDSAFIFVKFKYTEENAPRILPNGGGEVNSVAWVYLPYFAFLGLVIAGLHYQNIWVIAFGILASCLYDPKPELKIICERPVYYKCIFEKEKTK